MRFLTSLSVVALTIGLSACSSSSHTGRPNGWGAPIGGTTASTPRTPARTTPRTTRQDRVPTRPVSTSEPELEAADATLTASGLVVPVVGIEPDDLRDSFTSPRSGGRTHNAIDIAAPRGTPIVAVTDGVIRRKHWNALGGRTLYLTSEDGSTDYYYAHLDAYADDIEIGTRVRKGDVIGTVGSTGNAQGPHLHFQVLDRAGDGRGTPVNPYDLLSVPAIAGR